MDEARGKLAALGIEMDATMKRFCGDTDLLVEMLREFAAEDLLERLPAAIAESDGAAIERAAEIPELGQPFFDEDLEHPTYRRKLVKRYWVYYTYTDDTLTVRRIFHMTQDTDCYGFEILDD